MPPDSSSTVETVRPEQRETVRRAPPRRRARVLRFALMALILAVVFGALYGFNRFRENAIASFFANNKPPPVAVAAVEAKQQSVPRFLDGIGTLAAVRQVTVAPEVGGSVVQIFFEPGATVRAGTPLVQLNDKPEQGDLANFQAQMKLAELNLARGRQLVSRQAIPQATVDQYQAQLEEAKAGIARTQALIAQKLIRAPFDGVLGIRQVQLGEYLTPGGDIVTLTDLDTLYVNFTLPEQSRSQVAVGQAVRLVLDAFPGRSFEAKVTAIEPQVSADMRAIKIQATLANPDHALLPGMFAKVSVVLPPEPDVVTIPVTAVDYTVYGDSVFVIREDGADESGKPHLKAERIPVKTGTRFGDRVAILDGVKAGDRVVASGQLKLVSGAAVTITETEALATPSRPPLN